MPSSFRKHIKTTEYRKCFETIAPLVSLGNFDEAFKIMEEFQLGPNTVDNRGDNFLWHIIYALKSHDIFGPSKHGVGRRRDARGNFLTMADMIIDQGVDLNHQNKFGVTPLIEAAYSCSLDFCKLLLKRDIVKVDIYDFAGKTALDEVITSFYTKRFASQMNERLIRSELIRLLLLRGADPNRPYFNETNAPPTKYAKVDIYAWLKKEKKFFYKSPAHYVIERSKEIIEFYPEYKGREEEEPLRKVFFGTLKEMGKA